jgi:hypothetical protein
MTSNNTDWEKGWLYLRNDGVGLLPYAGKVLTGKPDAWFHGMSPPSRQLRLESLHYVKTSNRSRNICNRPLTPVTSTHI